MAVDVIIHSPGKGRDMHLSLRELSIRTLNFPFPLLTEQQGLRG